MFTGETVKLRRRGRRRHPHERAQPDAADVRSSSTRCARKLTAKPRRRRHAGRRCRGLLRSPDSQSSTLAEIWSTTCSSASTPRSNDARTSSGSWPRTPPSSASPPPSSSRPTTNGPSPNAATSARNSWPPSANPPPPLTSRSSHHRRTRRPALAITTPLTCTTPRHAIRDRSARSRTMSPTEVLVRARHGSRTQLPGSIYCLSPRPPQDRDFHASSGGEPAAPRPSNKTHSGVQHVKVRVSWEAAGGGGRGTSWASGTSASLRLVTWYPSSGSGPSMWASGGCTLAHRFQFPHHCGVRVAVRPLAVLVPGGRRAGGPLRPPPADDAGEPGDGRAAIGDRPAAPSRSSHAADANRLCDARRSGPVVHTAGDDGLRAGPRAS